MTYNIWKLENNNNATGRVRWLSDGTEGFAAEGAIENLLRSFDYGEGYYFVLQNGTPRGNGYLIKVSEPPPNKYNIKLVDNIE